MRSGGGGPDGIRASSVSDVQQHGIYIGWARGNSLEPSWVSHGLLDSAFHAGAGTALETDWWAPRVILVADGPQRPDVSIAEAQANTNVLYQQWPRESLARRHRRSSYRTCVRLK
jgi:hypothetical protein